jgi:hypothetical protein
MSSWGASFAPGSQQSQRGRNVPNEHKAEDEDDDGAYTGEKENYKDDSIGSFFVMVQNFISKRMVVMMSMLWCPMSMWLSTTIFKRKVWLPILFVYQAILPLFMILHWVHSVSIFYDFVYVFLYNTNLFSTNSLFPPICAIFELLFPCTVSSFIF